MKKTLLGDTGFSVGKLGMGLAEIGYELSLTQTDQAGEILNTALDNGINFLDTASCYGVSEELIGQTISKRRSEFFLATKAGHATGDLGFNRNSPGVDWSYKTITDSIDRSLTRLKTDHLDLVQLHSCNKNVLEQGDAITAMMDAKTSGKTIFIGYSGDNENAHWAVESGIFSTLQTSYNIVEQGARSSNLLKKAAEHKMGVIVKRPIAGGSWAKARDKKMLASVRGYDEVYLNRATKMQSLGVIENEPDDGIFTSIKFVQNDPNISVMIVGTKNPSHLINNIHQINSLENINDSVINELHERFDRLDENWVQQM